MSPIPDLATLTNGGVLLLVAVMVVFIYCMMRWVD